MNLDSSCRVEFLAYKSPKGSIIVPPAAVQLIRFPPSTFRPGAIVTYFTITNLSVMFFKATVLFLAVVSSVNALAIPYKRPPLSFGPFTPEQWSEYTQIISNAEASGAIQSKREPLSFGPFTPEQWPEYTQMISNAEASGAIQSKRQVDPFSLRKIDSRPIRSFR